MAAILRSLTTLAFRYVRRLALARMFPGSLDDSQQQRQQLGDFAHARIGKLSQRAFTQAGKFPKFLVHVGGHLFLLLPCHGGMHHRIGNRFHIGLGRVIQRPKALLDARPRIT
ncbi:hypothetical protein LMG30113_07521 [Burkholderia paludis]|nr:hypothetical protein LMG30113_07521 [Burkholderia paludis]